MIVITIEQGDNKVEFKFNNNHMTDASNFMQTCVETADYGTKISVVMDDEKEV